MNIKELLIGNITQQDLLAYFNANITYKNLPRFINGYVFKYRGLYNIIVNKNLSYYKRKKTIIHELAHIELSHLDNDNSLLAFHIDKYEDEANKYINYIKEVTNNE